MEGISKLETGGKVQFHFEYIQVLKCIALRNYGLRCEKNHEIFVTILALLRLISVEGF